jgi:hypothetical protein
LIILPKSIISDQSGEASKSHKGNLLHGKWYSDSSPPASVIAEAKVDHVHKTVPIQNKHMK